MVLLKCENSRIVSNMEWGECKIHLISPITNRPYCYHTEASMYAQTSFFVGVVFGQICNYQALRQLKSSDSIISLCIYPFLLILLTLTLCYVEVFQTGFGTRDLLFIHYGISGLPFALVIILWNVGRKVCVSFIIQSFEKIFKSKTSWQDRCDVY